LLALPRRKRWHRPCDLKRKTLERGGGPQDRKNYLK